MVKALFMDASHDDVFSRLNSAIEDWNAQIASSHRDLSDQIAHAQAHLARLLDPASAPAEAPREILAPRPPADPVAIEERDARIAALEDQVQSLLAELEQLQEALTAASAPPPPDPAVAELRETLARREAELATKDGLIASLEMEVTALRQANEQSSAEESYLEGLAAEMAALQEAAGASEARANGLLAENRQLSDTVQALRDQVAAAAAQPDLSGALSALQEELGTLQATLDAAEAGRSVAEEALAAAEAEAAALREATQLAAATQDAEAQAEADSLQELYEAALAANHDLESALRESREEADALRDAAIAQPPMDHAAPDSALLELRSQYDAALAANHELESALRESREEAAALLMNSTASAPLSSEAMDALRDELLAAQAELDTARAALQEATAAASEATSLRELLHQVEQQRAYLEGEAAESRREMDSLREQVAFLAATANGPAPAREPAAMGPPVEMLIKAFDGEGHKKRMGEILVEQGVLTAEQLHAILNEQSRDPQRRFGTLVVERGYTSEEMVARILAAQLRLPFVALDEGDVDQRATALISAHLSRLHRAIPVRQELGKLVVAMANPLDLIAIEDIELASKCHADPVVATVSSIERAFKRYYAQNF
jgi:chromosome segregation ATPase